MLAVRTVHPDAPNPNLGLNGVLVAYVICFVLQVLPPSLETPMMSGAGAMKWLLLRNDAQQV